MQGGSKAEKSLGEGRKTSAKEVAAPRPTAEFYSAGSSSH